MYLKNLINGFFIFKIFLLILTQEIYCQHCQLKEVHFTNKWIFTSINKANQWELLHTDQIAHGSSIYLHCTGQQGQIKKIDCIKGVFKPVLPQPGCDKGLSASVDKIQTEPYCALLNGITYQIHHHLNDRSMLELYTVCYSPSLELPLYVRHRAYGFQLQTPKYKGKDFTTDKVVTTERRDSFKPQNIHNAFNSLLGPKQKYITSDKDFVVHRGHLANAQDFLTYDQMDATYKYVNVMAQFDKVNQGNWKTIENWIHHLPMANAYVTVLTGTKDILTLSHSSNTNQQVNMFLMQKGKNAIPLWLYKVVNHNGVCHVFVTLNDRFEYNKKVAPTAFCTQKPCPASLHLNTNDTFGKTYCCDYFKFKSAIGAHTAICG